MSADGFQTCQMCGQLSDALSMRDWCTECEDTSYEIAAVEPDSPFDAGRLPCPQGGEDRWSARWLMGKMAYARWEDFEKVVERAKQAAHNEGFNVNVLFRVFRSTPKNSGGRPQADYHMTRYAAYLTAMSGDSRKPECAAALHYFAVKTREAEVRPPTVEMSDELIVAKAFVIIKQQLDVATAERDEATATNRILNAAIERDAPLVAKAEAHSGSDSAIHRQSFAREVQEWGRKQNIKILHEEVNRFLGHIGLFIKGERSDTGHATAEAQRRGLAFTDKGTAKNGHAWATGKLTAAGQDYAWKRITKYVAENTHLRLPRELRDGDSA